MLWWRVWAVFASLWEVHKLLQQQGGPVGTRVDDRAGHMDGPPEP